MYGIEFLFYLMMKANLRFSAIQSHFKEFFAYTLWIVYFYGFFELLGILTAVYEIFSEFSIISNLKSLMNCLVD